MTNYTNEKPVGYVHPIYLEDKRALAMEVSYVQLNPVMVPLYTSPPSQPSTGVPDGLILAASLYLGAVNDIFALRGESKPYNERNAIVDPDANRAFRHLDATGKALKQAIKSAAPRSL